MKHKEIMNKAYKIAEKLNMKSFNSDFTIEIWKQAQAERDNYWSKRTEQFIEFLAEFLNYFFIKKIIDGFEKKCIKEKEQLKQEKEK